MRSPRRAALLAACLLAGAIAAGCTSPTVQDSGGVSYTCCDATVVSTHWHAGQRLPVTWTRTATVPAGQRFPAVSLSAVLTGPFSKVAALKAAISQGRRGSLTARAAKITISRDPPASVVSVITIPADAPTGFYNLEIISSSGGGTVSGATIITVG